MAEQKLNLENLPALADLPSEIIEERWFAVALAEYNKVATESVTGMQNAYHALTVGFTLVLALLAAAFAYGQANTPTPPASPSIPASTVTSAATITPVIGQTSRGPETQLIPIVLQVLVPFGALLAGILWYTETGKVTRAGSFLNLCERRFSELYTPTADRAPSLYNKLNSAGMDKRPACWHQWLWTPTRVSKEKPQGYPVWGNLGMGFFWIFLTLVSSIISMIKYVPLPTIVWANAFILVSMCIVFIRFTVKLGRGYL
jgi:hypothetical protein